MIESGKHVLVDTNVIIESHRHGCWAALVGKFSLDTVQKCVEECETGNQRSRNPVRVDTETLRQSLGPKNVTAADIAALVTTCPAAADLDDGEKELLAYAMTFQKKVYLLCSPDRACVRVAYLLGLIDCYVSLEELCESAGVHPSLPDHYGKSWLSKRKTEFLLDDL